MKRQQTNQQLRERLEVIDRDPRRNKQEWELREREYDKTVGLLNMMNEKKGKGKR